MKKLFILFAFISILSFLFFAPIYTPENQPSLNAITPAISSDGFESDGVYISADKAILIDKETQLVLYSKNADSIAGMASTTKIMTAVVILEQMELEDLITITKESVGIEGSSIYLSEGEIFTVESLLYGLLLESGNDAACALAIGCSDNLEDFSILMNQKAAELGMKKTNFCNPHGLSHDEHYTTARDLAILTAYAMEIETFQKIVSTKKATIKPENSEYIRYLNNHNKLLINNDWITGVKTGYTKNDGRCLVSSGVKNGKELICVTLNGQDHWNDHKTLLNKGFETFEKRTLALKGEYAFEVPVVGGTKSFVNATNINEIKLMLPKDIDLKIKTVNPPFVYAPIEKGDIVGEIRLYYNDKVIYTYPLCATEKIEVKKVSFFKRFFS
jgi:D-alanyl-D-alanine carboxypeptidase (penicillin-binding protein 5/6)